MSPNEQKGKLWTNISIALGIGLSILLTVLLSKNLENPDKTPVWMVLILLIMIGVLISCGFGLLIDPSSRISGILLLSLSLSLGFYFLYYILMNRVEFGTGLFFATLLISGGVTGYFILNKQYDRIADITENTLKILLLFLLLTLTYNYLSPPPNIFTEGINQLDKLNLIYYAISIALAICLYVILIKNLRGIRASELSVFKPQTTMGNETPSQIITSMEDRRKTASRFEDFLKKKYSEYSYLGKGGFSVVYYVRKKTGQEFAVKTPLVLDPSSGKVFIHEISNWKQLRHENIVKIFDFNIIPFPYIVMELCDYSLKEWMLAQDKKMSPSQIASIIFDICEGLKYAHSKKIVHRDLKPENILIKNGIPKISDWGLARFITHSSSVLSTSFTPRYAAPEQLSKGMKEDEGVDIWQIGVIMYEMGCNHPPFCGEKLWDLTEEIKSKNPVPPSQINPEQKILEPIILKCLEKSPRNRYHSALELQKDLAKLP